MLNSLMKVQQIELLKSPLRLCNPDHQLNISYLLDGEAIALMMMPGKEIPTQKPDDSR